MTYYLMCKHGKGLYPNEFNVRFQTYSLEKQLDIGCCSVRGNKIIKLNKTEGLVKLSYVEFNNGHARVLINDCINKRIREFHVLRDNIQER